MRINSIFIENFRGINRVHAEDLGNTIIIAGQNGSGKSCIFDALRLLKSLYGGYQQNEWQQWLGEFQIGANNRLSGLKGLFNDPNKEIIIEAKFEIRDEERAFINKNAVDLLTEVVWRMLLPEAFQFSSAYRMAMFASQFREREPEVRARVGNELPVLKRELSSQTITGRLIVQPGSASVEASPSSVLSVLFSTYRPRDIGVIDYHSAQRHYGRENVQAVNISLDQSENHLSQHSLYNSMGKYNNVKSELASSYIKEALAEKAGRSLGSTRSLTITLQELFDTFFPDKKFVGPTPTKDGNLSFPVRTRSGSTHDLDDLSAGEKEILYGYLRIRNSAPQYSIILLDEPELHLNPRLIRNLPAFYRKNLGQALDNQLWLVSHSDALLREAVGKPGFDVFHMQPASLMNPDGVIGSQTNQLKPLMINRDLDVALTDLVGDLAAYQPGRKAVIFEGGGDTDFDQWMTSLLFPEIATYANLISGSNKGKVKALHEVLERAYERGDLPTKFYAIVDNDYDDIATDEHRAVNRFSWGVYHIENFLLNPEIIAQVVGSLGQGLDAASDKILDDLRNAARSTVAKAVRHKLTLFASQQMTRAINLSFNPAAENVAVALHAAVDRSMEKLTAVRTDGVSLDSIKAYEREVRSQIEEAFGDGSWKETLPGRDILRAYAGTLPNGISFEVLRNMIVNKMADLGFKPPQMAEVVSQIMNDK